MSLKNTINGVALIANVLNDDLELREEPAGNLDFLKAHKNILDKKENKDLNELIGYLIHNDNTTTGRTSASVNGRAVREYKLYSYNENNFRVGYLERTNTAFITILSEENQKEEILYLSGSEMRSGNWLLKFLMRIEDIITLNSEKVKKQILEENERIDL